MSDNKFQPGEEMFDEVSGHGFRGNLSEDEDAEGHATRVRVALPEDEDTEGHATRVRVALPEDEDTEGHAVRSGRALPDDEDDDGTEGHGLRVKV